MAEVSTGRYSKGSQVLVKSSSDSVLFPKMRWTVGTRKIRHWSEEQTVFLRARSHELVDGAAERRSSPSYSWSEDSLNNGKADDEVLESSVLIVSNRRRR